MQLRVARLCLDCEELHNANSCPRCASESYAFLSSWLPTEERRRWRRPAPSRAHDGPWWTESPAGMVRAFGRWLSGEPHDGMTGSNGPATRAADRAAQMNFDAAGEQQTPRSEIDIQLPKHDARKV